MSLSHLLHARATYLIRAIAGPGALSALSSVRSPGIPTRAMSSAPLPPYQHQPFQWTEPPAAGFAFGQKVDATPEGRAWVESGDAAGFTSIDTAKHDPL